MKRETSSQETDPPEVAKRPEFARDIMTRDVVSVPVGTLVRDLAALLLEKNVSAVPVLAPDHNLVGMVSDGDLIGRNDADRIARRDWWLTEIAHGQPGPEKLASIGERRVEEIMRAPVLTIDAWAPLAEIAKMLGVYDIKRLPVMQGGDMVGIVSRSDLVRALATQTPAPKPREPLSGLLSLFTGMMQTDVRPEDPPEASGPASAPPSAPAPPPVTASAFRELVSASEQTARDAAVEARHNAELERLRQIKAMLLEHLDNQVWSQLLERAKAAAAQGETSFELIRFPCDLCSDGGRKIDVAEGDWPTTLRGEPAEMYARWERELRPSGFRLRAQMAEYLDGIPSRISLALAWAAPEAKLTKA